MPAGRPTKYTSSMCDKVIELMSEGASKTEVSAALGIHWDTFCDWQRNNVEFSYAIKKGEKLSEAWWQRIARENLIAHPKGPQLNATLWYMNMKNRFGWRDKHELTGDPEKPIEVNAHVDFGKMTDDDLNRYLDQAKKG